MNLVNNENNAVPAEAASLNTKKSFIKWFDVLAAQRAKLSEEIMAGRLVATLSQDGFNDAARDRVSIVGAGSKYVLNCSKAASLFCGVFLHEVL